MKRLLSTSMSGRLVVAMVVLWGVAVAAQAPTYKLGRPPTQAELLPADRAVGPDGEGLPPGRGTAKEGEWVWGTRSCAKCHGPTGIEGPGPVLVAPSTSENQGIARYPFATMVWSWINQMMPLDLQMQHGALGYVGGRNPGNGILYDACCLKPDEVYAVTAYLLFRSGIIKQDEVMNQETLLKVQMPGRNHFAPPPYLDTPWKPGLRQAKAPPGTKRASP